MIDTYEIKPNFAYLSRKYGLDPRTVKKYYKGYDGKSTKRKKISMLDEYAELIKEKLSLPGSKISAVYFYLKNEKDYKGGYSTLTYFVRKHPEIQRKAKNDSHVRYESRIGEQLQFDWVESIKMISKYG